MKEFISTIQETKTKKKGIEYEKYHTTIPNAIVIIKKLKKGDKLIWSFESNKIILEIKTDSPFS
jgi:hypothetical protein